MGVNLAEKRDGFILDGIPEFNKGSFNSHGDHRIAMSFAVASLLASKKSQVHHTECVATSFPGFYELLNSLRVP
ncbi:MAG: hypothetical protein ACD_73C00254G0002 [uncultured bacterium]|nr:MAG: hypothetical protein ACD_73C00254G0002 [uncultured bacterium]